jgi:hypothetical protein
MAQLKAARSARQCYIATDPIQRKTGPMLRHAFFPAFKGQPTFLLWGGPGDMAILRDALTRIANGEPSLVVTNLPDVKSVDASTLLLKSAGRNTGLRRASSNELFFEWGLDHEWALDFAEKVDVLSRSGHPGVINIWKLSGQRTRQSRCPLMNIPTISPLDRPCQRVSLHRQFVMYIHSSDGGPAWTRTRNQTVMSGRL